MDLSIDTWISAKWRCKNGSTLSGFFMLCSCTDFLIQHLGGVLCRLPYDTKMHSNNNNYSQPTTPRTEEGLGLGICCLHRVRCMEYEVWCRNVTNNLFNTLYVRFNKRLNQSVRKEQNIKNKRKKKSLKSQICGNSTSTAARLWDALDSWPKDIQLTMNMRWLLNIRTAFQRTSP